MIEVGADRVVADPRELAGRRWAFLGHGASRTKDARPVHVALAATAAGRPTLLLGPEHGYHGVEQDMVPTGDARDPWTGVPIASLYGDGEGTLRPQPGLFDEIEILLIDVQDVGSRYYTYAATAVWAAEAALREGVEVRVLDRPNPLGGEVVEGPTVRPGFESFVGAFPHPVRHGLTPGEIVALELRRGGVDPGDGFAVVPMAGWRRTMGWRETGWPWVAPSPNMPTPETAVVYPGACLLEATEVSEGRGTTRPFLLLGAPGVDGAALAAELAGRDIPGVKFLPAFFRPGYQKHAGAVCGGVEQLVFDASVFPAFRAGCELLDALRTVAPEAFAWRREAYEFVRDRPAIDLLTGDAVYRECLESGEDWRDWAASWREEELAFREERRAVLLYD